MRCPKCHYLSFDDTDRCRHCGFDLSLAPQDAGVEVSIHPEAEAEGPTLDIDLRAASDTSGSRARRGRARRDTPAPAAIDLPLFEEPVPGLDDTPLIAAPSRPRPPIAVRRPTPDTGRQRPPSAVRPSLTPAAILIDEQAEREADVLGAEESAGDSSDETHRDEPVHPVTPGPRLLAAIIDLALVLIIDALVVRGTLWVTGLSFAEVNRLPIVPLAGFFALLNGGYLVGFTTASGQSIGKMLAGVRVVTDLGGRVPLGQAIVRALGVVAEIATLGLGVLPLFLGRERLTLADRLSHTRVVRA